MLGSNVLDRVKNAKGMEEPTKQTLLDSIRNLIIDLNYQIDALIINNGGAFGYPLLRLSFDYIIIFIALGCGYISTSEFLEANEVDFKKIFKKIHNDASKQNGAKDSKLFSLISRMSKDTYNRFSHANSSVLFRYIASSNSPKPGKELMDEDMKMAQGLNLLMFCAAAFDLYKIDEELPEINVAKYIDLLKNFDFNTYFGSEKTREIQNNNSFSKHLSRVVEHTKRRVAEFDIESFE